MKRRNFFATLFGCMAAFSLPKAKGVITDRQQCIYERWKADTTFRPRQISKWLRAAESDPRLFEGLVACAGGTSQSRLELQELLDQWIKAGRPDLGMWPQTNSSCFNIGELRAHLQIKR